MAFLFPRFHVGFSTPASTARRSSSSDVDGPSLMLPPQTVDWPLLVAHTWHFRTQHHLGVLLAPVGTAHHWSALSFYALCLGPDLSTCPRLSSSLSCLGSSFIGAALSAVSTASPSSIIISASQPFLLGVALSALIFLATSHSVVDRLRFRVQQAAALASALSSAVGSTHTHAYRHKTRTGLISPRNLVLCGAEWYGM